MEEIEQDRDLARGEMKARTRTQITESALKRNEHTACAGLIKASKKLSQMKSVIADVEHAIERVESAHQARVEFEKGKKQ